ncbi:Apoptotic chromatin condensation inducer in the nucleus, partial [Pseudolycoriella hygida]
RKMRRKSDRVKTPVAASPAKRSSRRSKRSASDTEERSQNSDNEHSEQNSGSEQDSDSQPTARGRKKLSRNTKATNDEKPVRSRRGRPARNIETVAEEDEEKESSEPNAGRTDENDEPAVTVEKNTPEEPSVAESIDTKSSNTDTVDSSEESTVTSGHTQQNNGSSEGAVNSPSAEEKEKIKEAVDEESRTRNKPTKEQPTSRRKHRRSSSDNNDASSTDTHKENQKKRKNRFSLPDKEADNNIEEGEIEDANDAHVEQATDAAPNSSKTPEKEEAKEAERSQEGDGRKSRGEKENKDRKKSDEKGSSSEKKQKPIRKRKWLTQKSTEPKPQILAISTDSLKNLISDVKPVPLSDIKLESSPEPEEVEIVSKSETINATNDSRDRSHRKEHRNDVKSDKRRDDSSSRKISIVSDDTPKVQRPPSPPKFSSSNILFITNLVRPFTVMQLKGLLARTGKIMEDGFWIDHIKSKCYVKYETEDEAIETRHALHGVRWPASNPKCLNVDFGSEKSMEKAIASTSEQPPKEGVTAAREERVAGGWDRFEVDERKEQPAITRPMREWDDSREVDRLERRKRSPDMNHSVSPSRKFHKKENEPPIRLLDDLFRKTKTVPCVYWLPLTSEQIALKEDERRKQLAEQKRRIEQREKERNEQAEHYFSFITTDPISSHALTSTINSVMFSCICD